MKLFNTLMRFATVAALALCALSCTETPGADAPVDPTVRVELSDATEANFSATSLTYSIEVEGYESYAYCVTKGEPLEPTEAVVIYNDAEQVYDITESFIESIIYGLEGGEMYTIEFAFKEKGKNVYHVETLDFTTPEYDKILTVIEAGMYNIKFAINAPENTYYRYFIMPRYDKLSLQANQPIPDSDFLMGGTIGKGPIVVDYVDGEPSFLMYEGSVVEALVKPGTSFVLMMAECDQDGKLLTAPVEMKSPTRGGDQPIIDGYNESAAGKRLSAIAYTCSKLPAPAAGKVNVAIETTEASAEINITPSEEVVAYSLLLLTPEEEALYNEWAGESGMATAVQKQSKPYAGEMKMTFTGLTVGQKYNLLIVHSSDALSQTRSVETIPIEVYESTKPPVKLVITDAKSDDPYEVVFNIKCPTGDCTEFKYVINSAQAWSTMFKIGATEEEKQEVMKTMLTVYGQTMDNGQIIDAINSAEGYNMEFDSWENTENIMATMTYNVDEHPYCSFGAASTIEEPARERVESELFESLKGDWTTTYDYKLGMNMNDPDSAVQTSQFKTTITDDPNFGPATFTPSHPDYKGLYDYWFEIGTKSGEADPADFATKTIAESFKDYVETAAKFKRKYREQNRLLMIGFTPYKEYETVNTWDLFCDTEYGAYNTDQIFFDFGQKMFINIRENDETVIEVNPKYIAPSSAHSITYHVGAVSCTSIQGQFDRDIPLIQDDADNLRIGGLSYTFDDGRVLDDFYLTFYFYDANNTPYPSTVGFAEPKMTRGYTAPAEPEALRVAQHKAAVPARQRFKRTYMPPFAMEPKSVPHVEVDCSKGMLK